MVDLKGKIGPAPMYVWIVGGGVVAGLGLRWYRSRNSAADPNATPSGVDTTNASTDANNPTLSYNDAGTVSFGAGGLSGANPNNNLDPYILNNWLNDNVPAIVERETAGKFLEVPVPGTTVDRTTGVVTPPKLDGGPALTGGGSPSGSNPGGNAGSQGTPAVKPPPVLVTGGVDRSGNAWSGQTAPGRVAARATARSSYEFRKPL